jgi:hypothetical protein
VYKEEELHYTRLNTTAIVSQIILFQAVCILLTNTELPRIKRDAKAKKILIATGPIACVVPQVTSCYLPTTDAQVLSRNSARGICDALSCSDNISSEASYSFLAVTVPPLLHTQLPQNSFFMRQKKSLSHLVTAIQN